MHKDYQYYIHISNGGNTARCNKFRCRGSRDQTKQTNAYLSCQNGQKTQRIVLISQNI